MNKRKRNVDDDNPHSKKITKYKDRNSDEERLIRKEIVSLGGNLLTVDGGECMVSKTYLSMYNNLDGITVCEIDKETYQSQVSEYKKLRKSPSGHLHTNIFDYISTLVNVKYKVIWIGIGKSDLSDAEITVLCNYYKLFINKNKNDENKNENNENIKLNLYITLSMRCGRKGKKLDSRIKTLDKKLNQCGMYVNKVWPYNPNDHGTNVGNHWVGGDMVILHYVSEYTGPDEVEYRPAKATYHGYGDAFEVIWYGFPDKKYRTLEFWEDDVIKILIINKKIKFPDTYNDSKIRKLVYRKTKLNW